MQRPTDAWLLVRTCFVSVLAFTANLIPDLTPGKCCIRPNSARDPGGIVMDEASENMIVTVAAMKVLLGRLYALMYRQMKLSPSHVPAMHKTLIENWSTVPLVNSSDPAVSDLMSDEVLQEIERILRWVEKDFRAMQ
jgi:hypothetical protein